MLSGQPVSAAAVIASHGGTSPPKRSAAAAQAVLGSRAEVVGETVVRTTAAARPSPRAFQIG